MSEEQAGIEFLKKGLSMQDAAIVCSTIEQSTALSQSVELLALEILAQSRLAFRLTERVAELEETVEDLKQSHWTADEVEKLMGIDGG